MLLAGIVLITAGVIFVTCAAKMSRYAEENKDRWKETTGTIVGYNVEDYSSWETPLIRFMDNGEEVTARGAPIRERNCPPAGTSVQIRYLKNEFPNRKPTWQVHVKESETEGKDYLLKVVIGLGIALCAFGVVVIALF